MPVFKVSFDLIYSVILTIEADNEGDLEAFCHKVDANIVARIGDEKSGWAIETFAIEGETNEPALIDLRKDNGQ